MSDTYDINALSKVTDTPVRTLRFWVAEGILPPPSSRGPAASYGPGHRDRVTLIRRLQNAHLPLAAIRAQLEALDDAGVAAALAAPGETPQPVSALDYVQQVLGKTAKRHPPSDPGVSLSLAAAAPVVRGKRSTWERIALHPDIELHVRRPLARADQRRLDALLQAAERLFAEDG
jgi:DNA-binding transcriptional MerR regulator